MTELTISEIEAAAEAAIALIHAHFLELDFCEASFKLGFADGCAYMCNLMQQKLKEVP